MEENANLVIRLLIRRPECLGPALRGEGAGLLAAIKDAIKMSEKITAERSAANKVVKNCIQKQMRAAVKKKYIYT